MRALRIFLILALLPAAGPRCVFAADPPPAEEAEAPLLDESAADLSLNENDVRSFVYHWFAELDRRAGEQILAENLNGSDLRMQFPEALVTSRDQFREWYRGQQETIESNLHEIEDLRVERRADEGGFDVHLTVRWQARTYQGQSVEARYRQQWKVSPDDSGRLLIRRYLVEEAPQ